jgi:hypothetical protein
MSASPPIQINVAKRILKQKNVLCGGIITGTDKIRSGFGNGDCLYFDFTHRVFAVADGSERFPGASRDLLKRLSENLERAGAPDSAQGWKELIDTKVYSEQKFQHRTTLSCVAVKDDDGGTRLIVSHGGDSAVTMMDSANGNIYFRTSCDMNFGGRSREITDVTEHRVSGRNTRVIISTDGFNDLLRFCTGQSIFSGLQDVIAGSQVDGIGELIHGVLEANSGAFEYDDIGYIIIAPFGIDRINMKPVFIGGTRPHDEKRFLTEYSSGLHDRWISGRDWAGFADLFEGAGILTNGR